MFNVIFAHALLEVQNKVAKNNKSERARQTKVYASNIDKLDKYIGLVTTIEYQFFSCADISYLIP